MAPSHHEHGVEASERTHASAWVPATDILRNGISPTDRTKIALADRSEGRTSRKVTSED